MTQAITTTNIIETCIEVNRVDSLNLPSTIVVIDSGIPDYEKLAAGVIVGAQVHILKPQEDGIEQISQILRAVVPHPNSSSLALHLVCSGLPGCLFLGNTCLSLKTIERYAWELQSWFTTLPSQLLLYGCQVGAGIAGGEFLQSLHTLTGATIHASTLKIGHAALGGSWNLDVSVGSLKPTVAFTVETQATYTNVF